MTQNLQYISPHGKTGWLVRVPHAYFHDGNARTLRYKQKSFPFLKHGGSEAALIKAEEFRSAHLMPNLKYNDRGPDAGNGKQVSHKKRIRGSDLPVGIIETLRHSRQGKEQYSIDVQVMCGNASKTRSFMYGHSRTREEAVAEAKATLEKFLTEIEVIQA